ncbi:MAG: carbon-nitrogen hydrolase, partial [candidate division Zixibacteria bacterium]|nr:carbon-nitrogen hydrolase [candidate division Zixibacteria bacterium]
FLQFAPVLGDRTATRSRIETLLPSTVDIDLLVLPELANSGYNFRTRQEALEASELVVSGPFVEFMVSLSTRLNCHIVFGLNERAGDQLYNSAVLVDPRGPRATYRKLHLFVREKEFFTPGDNGLPVVDIGFGRAGMLVCFDWMFPEVWRILALRGADVICHPSNLVIPGLAQRAVPVHALTNRLYTVTANRIGSEHDLTFTGMSVIADPGGNVIARAEQTAEALTIVDIDLAYSRDKMITERNHVLNDRRPEVYGDLVAATGSPQD